MTLGLILILVISWTVPVLGVVNNQRSPSYASALGVAYAFFAGCVIHLVAGGIWTIVRWGRMDEIAWISLLASFVIMIVLAALSNRGALSKVSA